MIKIAYFKHLIKRKREREREKQVKKITINNFVNTTD